MVKITAQQQSGSSISKTIGWLNKNSNLTEKIQFNEVVGPLMACGEKVAAQLLTELGEKQGQIRDPTKWLAAAALRKTGGAGGDSWGAGSGAWMMVGGKGGGGKGGGGMGGGDKVSKQVGWINKNLIDQMAEPIQFNEVQGPLSLIGEKEGCAILKEFSEKASEIKSPTNWIKAAAMRKTGMGGSWAGAAGGKGGGGMGGGDGQKISKQIGWINKNLIDQMAEPIQFNEVQGPLMMIGDKEGCAILKEFSEKPGEIKSPTNWIKAAAMRKMGMGGMGAMGGMGGMGAIVPMGGSWAPAGKGGGKGGSGMGGGDGQKISKQIGWINKNLIDQMPEPIQFNEVQGPLMMLGDKLGCALLKEFSEKASEIKSPTNWIKAAAMRKMQF